MDIFTTIKDHHSEKQLFVARVILSTAIATLLLGTVIARLIQLQVYDYELFAEQSQGNRIRIQAVAPTRGLILDRKGRVLAENLPAYQLEMIPELVGDIDDTLRRLATLGLIENNRITYFKKLAKSGPRFKPVTLRFRLNEDELADFALQRHRFPGVDFQPRLVRHYPHARDSAHVIGYVGALSTNDLNRLDAAEYAGTSHTGKSGIEFQYEKLLHGNTGHSQIVTNARGRQVPSDRRDLSQALPENVAPHPGQTLYLSIDLDLQQTATDALHGRRGAVVAIDPNNGEILAQVSSPTFDSNNFSQGMTEQTFKALQSDPNRPLFNRAVLGNYPPG